MIYGTNACSPGQFQSGFHLLNNYGKNCSQFVSGDVNGNHVPFVSFTEPSIFVNIDIFTRHIFNLYEITYKQ